MAVPFLSVSNLPFSEVTWNYTTTPQAALNQRILPYSRGRVLGGSSSLSAYHTLYPFAPPLTSSGRFHGVHSRSQRRVRQMGESHWRWWVEMGKC